MAMLVELIKKRQDLSREKFREYYETQHAPFNIGNFRHVFAGYTRSYIGEDLLNTEPGDRPVDVVTRIEFANADDMEQIFTLSHTVPGLQAAIFADEEAFMDRATTHMMLTDDVRSPLAAQPTNPAGQKATAATLIALIKRRPGLTHDEFRTRYETRRAPLVLRHLEHLMTGYTRSYVTSDYLNTKPGDRPVDVVTCIEFAGPDAMADMLSLASSNPDLHAAIAADEAEFIDRDATHVMLSTDRSQSVPV